MESTGVYWIPVFEILEARGFEVLLVNARDVKNVPGRKTDVNDAQWLQQLHQYGLLRGSFRPREALVRLRAYLRHRERLVEYAASHIQHMQKALMQMNVQLHHVVSDITGLTGMRIIRAIVAGQNAIPSVLAEFRDAPLQGVAKTRSGQALTGNYRPEHVFALRQALELYDVSPGEDRGVRRGDRGGLRDTERRRGRRPKRHCPSVRRRRPQRADVRCADGSVHAARAPT